MMIGVGLDARLGLPLSAGLDEAIVRVITARPGLEPVAAAMAALTPSRIRA